MTARPATITAPILSALTDRAARLLEFLWSGWVGLAALFLLAAAWQAGHEAYGPFILTSPLDTVAAAARLAQDPASWAVAGLTLQRAVTGFALVGAIGVTLGLAAGYSPATMRLLQPLITVLLGVPPIAWIVLAMIWFGGSDATVRMVIVVSALPVVFLGAAQGIATRDRGLDRMAQAFGAGPVRRFLTVGLRQTTVTLFPALVLALGTAFKVAVMAELLANAGGIGGALAGARINLDIATALAWVLIAVALLIAVEYTLVHPIKGEIDRWRRAAQPWGVKR
ncbi:MAG: ABC transporter permease subunit [Paracoccus sp. (in: a-proteobacteria)]|uniref:ABC transporter permease n=1 Tax=Paracoccus sp. TaxID=267 RepID=UPI0026E09D8B|nr:ABC transporter permease subunit [Paracoccus sp. (in: a-proteobacteria)]MDO5614469.1 ABC transporter permease subunit [Paracoccus sp. (in: a-proteobacteria)]